MSKLITTRFEHVVYDDTSGVLSPPKGTPPTYPPPLDTYSTSSTASAAQSYGAYIVSGTGTAMPLMTPPGATITLIGATSNASLVLVSQSAVALTPGGVPSTIGWPVGPGQIVTFPGVFNTGTLSVQGCSATYAVNATPFTLTVMWSI